MELASVCIHGREMPRVNNGFTIAPPLDVALSFFIFHRPQKEEKTRRRKTKKDEKRRKKIKRRQNRTKKCNATPRGPYFTAEESHIDGKYENK